MKTNMLVGAVALVVIAAGAVLQGRISDRWTKTTSEKLERFTQRLDAVPTEIGDWIGVDTEVDQEQFAASNCAGCVSRTYQDRRTGQEVSVYLVSGTARHVTIHTPDWCYQGAGYEMRDQPISYNVQCGDREAEFRVARFVKEETTNVSRLRILWSYTDDGNWQGPKWPKPAFAGRPALYKVYLIRSLGEDVPKLSEDPAVEFAKQFIPIVNAALFSQSDQQATESKRETIPTPTAS